MADWYIVYVSDGEKDVMTVSGEFAQTEEEAREELTYSLPSATIIQVTQDPSQIQDDLDVISLDEAAQVLDDPNAVIMPDPKSSH